jgi:hypothetical protein
MQSGRSLLISQGRLLPPLSMETSTDSSHKQTAIVHLKMHQMLQYLSQWYLKFKCPADCYLETRVYLCVSVPL